MKFPICRVCLTNELLCNACAERVGEMEIKIDEIKMFRRMNKILGKQKGLSDAEIKRAVSNDKKSNLIIIARSEDVSRLIGKEGSIVKKLAKTLNIPIRIIGQPTDVKNFVDEILFTVSIVGINILYKPNEKIYRIRIPRSERTRLPIPSHVLANVSRSLFKENVDVIFE